MYRKLKLTRNYAIDNETESVGIESAILDNEGMDFDDILKNDVLKQRFSVGGIYLISVKIDAYKQFIKIGLSNSNMINRITSHRTTLFPVHEYLKVHCLAVKKNNRNVEEQDERVVKSTFVKKAEQNIKDYLSNLKQIPENNGEWYKIEVSTLIDIMLLHHFGNKALGIKADGFKCKIYVFNPRKCFEIKPEIWGDILNEEPLMRKPTRRARFRGTYTE